MSRGFTLIEVLVAALLLGVGLTTILVSMTQCQKMMLISSYSQTAQEVMDWGEMAYPLENVADEDDIDIRETKATRLWELISDDSLTREQEEKFHGYTWERELVFKNMDEDEINRLGGLCPVRITVKWGDDFRGHHEEESYVVFWRRPQK